MSHRIRHEYYPELKIKTVNERMVTDEPCVKGEGLPVKKYIVKEEHVESCEKRVFQVCIDCGGVWDYVREGHWDNEYLVQRSVDRWAYERYRNKWFLMATRPGAFLMVGPTHEGVPANQVDLNQCIICGFWEEYFRQKRFRRTPGLGFLARLFSAKER